MIPGMGQGAGRGPGAGDGVAPGTAQGSGGGVGIRRGQGRWGFQGGECPEGRASRVELRVWGGDPGAEDGAGIRRGRTEIGRVWNLT